jgi:hypothetical protein
VHDAAPKVEQHHEDEKNAEGGGRDDEEVDGNQIGDVILEEGLPRLRGGPRRRGMTRATERCEMVNPSLRSSPWILGAPQSGLACAIFWMRALSSAPTGGRPGPLRLDFQVQKVRNPCRCQRASAALKVIHPAGVKLIHRGDGS